MSRFLLNVFGRRLNTPIHCTVEDYPNQYYVGVNAFQKLPNSDQEIKVAFTVPHGCILNTDGTAAGFEIWMQDRSTMDKNYHIVIETDGIYPGCLAGPTMDDGFIRNGHTMRGIEIVFAWDSFFREYAKYYPNSTMWEGSEPFTKYVPKRVQQMTIGELMAECGIRAALPLPINYPYPPLCKSPYDYATLQSYLAYARTAMGGV